MPVWPVSEAPDGGKAFDALILEGVHEGEGWGI